MNSKLIRILKPFVPAIMAVLILSWVLKLHTAVWTVPFLYGEDALLVLTAVKILIQEGWVTVSPQLGAPYSLVLYDFPSSPDTLFFLFFRFLSLFSSNPSILLNVFFLIKFPIIATVSYLVFESFAFGFIASTVGAVLFSFSPYSFYRGVAHLFLAFYFIVPLVVLLTVWIMNNSISFSLKDKKLWALLIISVLSAGTGIYYAYFACLFIGFAGLWNFFHLKSLSPFSRLKASLLSISVVVATELLFAIPTLRYYAQNGRNYAVAARMFFESEIYGLKIIQMLLPVPGHFVGKLSSLSERYLALSPYISENRMSSLGLVAAFGFFIMTAWGLLRPKFTSKPFSDQSKRRISLLDQLSSLNMFSVLIATIGGFGTLIAFLFFPSIRAYNRISIYIAFFSLAFLIALILELFSKFRSRWVQFAKVFLLISLLVFGVWDQTGKIGTDATTGIRSFASDKKFVEKITSTVPKGSKIFQLPFSSFPESPPISRMRDYEHVKLFLHSGNHIHWSYPSVVGRPASEWQKKVTSLPIADFVTRIYSKGFVGVAIDSLGYDDNGEKLLSELEKFSNGHLIRSDDSRRIFVPLSPNATLEFDGSSEEPRLLRIANPKEPIYLPKEFDIKRIAALTSKLPIKPTSRPIEFTIDDRNSLYDFGSVRNRVSKGPIPSKELRARIDCTVKNLIFDGRGPQTKFARISITNLSKTWWPHETSGHAGMHQIRVRSRLYDVSGKVLNNDFLSVSNFSEPLRPGGLSNMEMRIESSWIPGGTSFVEFDLVQEGNAWSSQAGGKTCRVKLTRKLYTPRTSLYR